MQTFLPLPNFTASAKVLDYQRLGKQRVEVIQIFKALTLPSYGWSHHPATLMWSGFEEALLRYGLDICIEWKSRGYKDTCYDKLLLLAQDTGLESVRTQKQLTITKDLPSWLGNQAFHLSHQSNLLRKDLHWYRQFFPTTPDDLPYIWPVHKDN